MTPPIISSTVSVNQRIGTSVPEKVEKGDTCFSSSMGTFEWGVVEKFKGGVDIMVDTMDQYLGRHYVFIIGSK